MKFTLPHPLNAHPVNTYAAQPKTNDICNTHIINIRTGEAPQTKHNSIKREESMYSFSRFLKQWDIYSILSVENSKTMP